MRQVTVRSSSAIRTARSTRWRTWSGTLAIWTYSPATSLNSVTRSTSCWYAPPMAVRADWPTIASTGWWSILASYSPFSRWMAPGPEVARHTPISPVNLACAHAMKAAISSCRTWMKSGSPSARSSAPMIPLMPSPG